MAIPTDRGYVVITANPDGTTTLAICAQIEGGRPVGVFARHVQQPSVQIHPAVKLAQGNGFRYTTHVAEVFPAKGAVQVRVPRTHM
jgi:hypothetical protein